MWRKSKVVLICGNDLVSLFSLPLSQISPPSSLTQRAIAVPSVSGYKRVRVCQNRFGVA